MHFGKKQQKILNFVLHVLLPLIFCVTGPIYQSVHCKKKKNKKRKDDVSPSRNAQTIEMAHMHEH